MYAIRKYSYIRATALNNTFFGLASIKLRVKCALGFDTSNHDIVLYFDLLRIYVYNSLSLLSKCRFNKSHIAIKFVSPRQITVAEFLRRFMHSRLRLI